MRNGLKVVVAGATGILLGIGLCGAGVYQDRNVHDGAPGWFDTLGGLVLVLSLGLLLVGAVIALLEGIPSKSNGDK